MRTSDGRTRQQTIALLSVFAAAACAVQTEGFVENYVALPTGGTGGDTSGTAAAGGTMGVGGATGTGGTGTGGTGTGGTGTGGTGGTGGMANGTGGTASATGGTSNAGTGSSTGGASAGMTAMGGRAGRAGRGAAGAGGTGAGGMGPVGTEASGCAKLSVPLNGANDKAHFVISLRSATDLSVAGTTISLRVYVEDGIGGVIFAYAQDSSFNFLGAATRPMLASQTGWVTLTWDVAAEPAMTTGITKRSISRIGIEIKAAPSTTWSNPTVVYVDSISVDTTPALSFPFGTTSTVSATAQTTDPTGQVLWLNSDADDTTASGSKVSWVATCP